jgi:NADPH:quinone reductase-like Zn-dependent oxidoreductase
MGSRREFKELVQYIADKRIRPVVDSVHSLEDVEKAFEVMKAGTNFGKIVVQVHRDTAKI